MRYSFILKTVFLICLSIFATSCKEDPQRHLELGEWYAQKGLVDDASSNNLKRDEFRSLSQAHYNLSLMYTKKGWWDYALKEAEICFQLQPTKKHFELLDLIKKRVELESSDS